MVITEEKKIVGMNTRRKASANSDIDKISAMATFCDSPGLNQPVLQTAENSRSENLETEILESEILEPIEILENQNAVNKKIRRTRRQKNNSRVKKANSQASSNTTRENLSQTAELDSESDIPALVEQRRPVSRSIERKR